MEGLEDRMNTDASSTRSPWRAALLIVGLAAAALLLWALSPGGDRLIAARNAEEMVGAVAPDFQLKTIDGKQVALRDQPRYVYVLDFWTISCPPCRSVAPVLQDIHKKYGFHGVRVVGVNLADSSAAIKKYMENNGYTYIQTTDRGAVANAYGIFATPTVVVIDRKGVVRDVMVGLGPGWESRLESIVKTVAGEK
jgi:thiol-disulfide isomerase/thioredoxin